MTEALLQHIQKLVPGFTITAQQLAPFFHTRQVPKEEVLLRENEPCTDLYFVNSGCLYLYYTRRHEKQVIHFALENWWLTDYKTFADGKPAVYAIAAMEDSAITSIDRKAYEALQTEFPLMGLYFNKIHERAYGAALYKQQTYATLSKQEFYDYFRHTYPDVIRRVPHDIFASYMGVSPQTLQLIREEDVS